MGTAKLKDMVCVGSLVFGILLTIASFIVPPLGVVDNSVLTAIGEIFTFVGAYAGFDVVYRRGLMKYGLNNQGNEKEDEEQNNE